MTAEAGSGAAWLLLEPNGPRKISPAVLSAFGANNTADYENVGTITKPSGVGGYVEAQAQSLWKPTRDIPLAARACEAIRAQRLLTGSTRKESPIVAGLEWVQGQ